MIRDKVCTPRGVLFPFMKGVATLRDLEGVIENTLVDRLIFGDVMDKSQKLQDMSDSLAEAGLQKSDVMVSDLWSSLYKTSPKIKQVVPINLALNKAILEQLCTLPEWPGLKKSCTLDELTSAIGTLTLSKNMSQLLSRKLKNSTSRIKKADLLKELAETLRSLNESPDGGSAKAENVAQSAIEQAERSGDINNKTASTALNKLREGGIDKALAYLKKKAVDAQADAESEVFQIAESIRCDIRDALKQTAEETELLSDAVKQYRGYDRSASVGSRISIEEAFKAADMILNHPESAKIQEIARLAGRMSHVALKAKKAAFDSPTMEQWSGFTEGRDISRLLPQELIALKNPVLRKDFLKRFADGKLLEYEIDPRQNAGKGPLVVCIDESGSMHGQREIWAKAVALSLLKIAQKERRPYALIRFNSTAQWPEYFHPKKKVMPSRIMEVFSDFLSGGTSFEEPLKSALKIIEKHKAYKKSDIVFVTDGKSYITDEFRDYINKVKRERKISILTVRIESDADGVECFSDYIYCTEAVNTEDGKEVLSLFFAQKEAK